MYVRLKALELSEGWGLSMVLAFTELLAPMLGAVAGANPGLLFPTELGKVTMDVKVGCTVTVEVSVDKLNPAAIRSPTRRLVVLSVPLV